MHNAIVFVQEVASTDPIKRHPTEVAHALGTEIVISAKRTQIVSCQVVNLNLGIGVPAANSRVGDVNLSGKFVDRHGDNRYEFCLRVTQSAKLVLKISLRVVNLDIARRAISDINKTGCIQINLAGGGKLTRPFAEIPLNLSGIPIKDHDRIFPRHINFRAVRRNGKTAIVV